MYLPPQQFRTPWKTLERNAIRDWMAGMHFTHFVTLTSNNQMATRYFMKDKLRAWDARVNRDVVGPKWQKRIDERVNWIAFPEKFGVNPHWHVLMQLLPEQLEELESRCPLEDRLFDDVLRQSWTKFVPSGTVDVQPIRVGRDDKKRVYDYVTKSLGHEPNLEDFVMFREYFEL